MEVLCMVDKRVDIDFDINADINREQKLQIMQWNIWENKCILALTG